MKHISNPPFDTFLTRPHSSSHRYTTISQIPAYTCVSVYNTAWIYRCLPPSYFTILIRMYEYILLFSYCYAFLLRLYMQTTSNIYADKHQSIPYIIHNNIYISAFYAWWIKWSFKYKSGRSLYQSMYSWMDRNMRSNNTLVINQIWLIWESDLYGSYHYIMD